MMGKVKTHHLLKDVTATGAGAAAQPLGSHRTFHAFGNTTAGAGATTIGVEVSNDGVNFFEIDVLSITLATTVASDVYENQYPYAFVRGNVKTLTGTGAKVSLIMGAQL